MKRRKETRKEGSEGRREELVEGGRKKREDLPPLPHRQTGLVFCLNKENYLKLTV